MKERKQRQSRLDPNQAEWEIIGGSGTITDEAADAVARLLWDAAEREVAEESAVSKPHPNCGTSNQMDRPLKRTDFLAAIQEYVANIAIGASSLRNQGAPGVIDAARQFLAGLPLRHLKGIEPSRYGKWLDKATYELQASFPDGAKDKWGAARKAINIFMCHAQMNRELSSEYELDRLAEAMETPLDKLSATKLCEWAAGRRLPRWLGVGSLTPEVSRAYQDFALEIAKQKGIPRACLDVLLWTKAPKGNH